MGDIFDYLKWRGDLSFSIIPFNEIDNLICSRISYFPLELILKKNEKITLGNLYMTLLDHKKALKKEEDLELLRLLSLSERYKYLTLANFESDTNLKEEKQFAAVTIELPEDVLYISFRGTDNTFIGWKEDFNMTFLETIPSRESAANYLNNTHVGIKTKLYVGGHSKGGNLAVYAAMKANINIKRKIITVFNNDGPGFLEDVIESPEYKLIENKIKTFIPQSSVVGRLLNSNNIYQVIKSDEIFLLQHDLFSWKLECDHFEYLDEVNQDSDFVKEVMNEWLAQMSKEERENFADILYKILTSTNKTTFKELSKNKFMAMKDMLSSYKNLNEKDKKMTIKILEYLYKSIKDSTLKKSLTKN